MEKKRPSRYKNFLVSKRHLDLELNSLYCQFSEGKNPNRERFFQIFLLYVYNRPGVK